MSAFAAAAASERAGRAFHVLALPELDPRHHAALDDAIDLGRAAAADELANLDLLSRRGLARIDQLEIGAGFELRGGNGEFQIGVYDDLSGFAIRGDGEFAGLFEASSARGWGCCSKSGKKGKKNGERIPDRAQLERRNLFYGAEIRNTSQAHRPS